MAINQKFYMGASKQDILIAINPKRVKEHLKPIDEVEGIRDDRYTVEIEMPNEKGEIKNVIPSWQPVLLMREEKKNLDE